MAKPWSLITFCPEDPTARPIPFSEKALQTAALEWMVATNQVCTRHFLSRVLMYMKLYSQFKRLACRLQENARYCVSSKSEHSTPITQAVKGANYQDVQAAAALAAGSP